MRITVETKVTQPIDQVFAGFNEQLFLKLAPPFPPIKLLRFDGCKKDHQVHLQLNFIFFKQNWQSLITENYARGDEIAFVDEGTRLPFFLKKWRHHHRMVATEDGGSIIIDDITYSAGNGLFDLFLYVPLWLQFLYRKPIYRRVFNRATPTDPA